MQLRSRAPVRPGITARADRPWNSRAGGSGRWGLALASAIAPALLGFGLEHVKLGCSVSHSIRWVNRATKAFQGPLV